MMRTFAQISIDVPVSVMNTGRRNAGDGQPTRTLYIAPTERAWDSVPIHVYGDENYETFRNQMAEALNLIVPTDCQDPARITATLNGKTAIDVAV